MQTSNRRWRSMGMALCVAVLTISTLRLGSVLGDGKPEDGAKEKDAPAASSTADWYLDADCRLVFFATLEGLYEDGVPTEVVDLIVGTESKLSNKVKHDFVFQCKLCHAVYEAFVLYQRRQTFNGSDVDTFKESTIDPKLIEGLRSDAARTRVYAMGNLVQPWIKRKLLELNIDDAAKKSLMDRLHVLVQEGYDLIAKHRRNDPEYGEDWLFYGSCQACEAVKTVSKMLDQKD